MYLKSRMRYNGYSAKMTMSFVVFKTDSLRTQFLKYITPKDI